MVGEVGAKLSCWGERQKRGLEKGSMLEIFDIRFCGVLSHFSSLHRSFEIIG